MPQSRSRSRRRTSVTSIAARASSSSMQTRALTPTNAELYKIAGLQVYFEPFGTLDHMIVYITPAGKLGVIDSQTSKLMLVHPRFCVVHHPFMKRVIPLWQLKRQIEKAVDL